MAFSPTPTVLLAIVQADHSDKITSAERESASPQPWRKMQNPPSCLRDSLRFSLTFLLKLYNWAESSASGLVKSPPDCWLFWLKGPFLSIHTCLSNYWFLNSEHSSLSSLTRKPANFKMDDKTKGSGNSFSSSSFLLSSFSFFLSCFCIFNHYLACVNDKSLPVFYSVQPWELKPSRSWDYPAKNTWRWFAMPSSKGVFSTQKLDPFSLRSPNWWASSLSLAQLGKPITYTLPKQLHY